MTHSKNALFFVLITVCLDSIGIGIIIPSFPVLVSETAHVSINESSKYYGFVMMMYALLQFLFSPMVGNLSDRFGRRPILLMSMLGMGLDYIFMCFAPDLFWLVLGRAIAGIFGASFTSAAAYIADISSPENRAKNFGMIGAAFGIGFVIGPAIGGLLTDFGSRAPFFAAACFSLLNFIYGLIVLKESLSIDQRRAFDWKRANPFGAFKQILKFEKNKYLFLVIFLVLLSNMGIHSLWNYYTMDKFAWKPKDIGISLAVVGVAFGVIQGGMAGAIVKKLGEKGAATLGLIALVITTVAMGLIPYGWMMYVLIFPYALCGIIEPSIRSIVSNKVEQNEQGELQGIFTSLMSLSEILSPLFFVWIYYSTTRVKPTADLNYGVSFFVCGFIAFLAFWLLRWTLKRVDS
jgi:DHA1 family tetracycline resistance protein-like MFS transporter